MRLNPFPRLFLTLILSISSVAAFAEEPTTRWQDHLKLTFSDRIRFEYVDWFQPPDAAAPGDPERYAFVANRLRFGARLTFPSWQAVVELQDTRILSLPNDANLPAPVGNLGPGALYYGYTRDRNQGGIFIKQGYLTLRRSGFAFSGGRMEISEGLESIPGNRTLAELKRTRIGQRLLGPFGYTHVSRSFDAAKINWDRPTWNVTAFGGRPTRGGFEVNANRSVDDVYVAGLAYTAKSLPIEPPVDLRAFYLFYRDSRIAPVIVDNRPLAVREADDHAIEVHTVGGHALTVLDWGPGSLDLLAWAAIQGGEWGRQSHFGWAYALELGYRLPLLPGAPWLRVGWNRSSGDDDPTDSDHETFFQVLPTARIYARLPFFNMMNNSDVFAELQIQPHPRVRLRADYHWLRLSEKEDLWYAGGGASNQKVFGFGGTPSGGDQALAHLVDLGITLGPWRGFTLSGYYGHAFGGQVVGNTFSGKDADYAFTELTFKY